MSAYADLRTALRRHNGICTAWEVRRELAAYLKQFSVKPPFDWSEVMTREEYFALVNRRKKRKPKRKKGDADPILFVYESIEDGRQEVKGHLPELDEFNDKELAWIDQFAKRQELESEDSAYHGEW